MSQESESPEHFLRSARYWLSLPFVAYLLAIPGLGPAALFVPIVIWDAPLGVMRWFSDVKLTEVDAYRSAFLAFHIVFWGLFTFALCGRCRLSTRVLTIIWLTLVTLLLMSITGCYSKPGEGPRSSGNWH
jgi:hypothetical protein